MELRQSPEAPSEYRLLVRWQTLENHTVDFRGSADFLEWRKLTAHCFAEPPVIKNWSGAVAGFGSAKQHDPEKACPGLDHKRVYARLDALWVGTGFRKRSCSNKKLDDDPIRSDRIMV